jgi:hypothetical protein
MMDLWYWIGTLQDFLFCALLLYVVGSHILIECRFSFKRQRTMTAAVLECHQFPEPFGYITRDIQVKLDFANTQPQATYTTFMKA